MMPPPQEADRAMVRHALATLAYRGAKALRDAPAAVPAYRAAPGSRTPLELLAHMGDLMEWALSLAKGEPAWHDSTPVAWEKEETRFFETLGRFDDCLASSEPLHASLQKLFQGPVADTLTHIGQIAMLRRMAGSPMRGENYFVADVVVGRVGPDQAAPTKEFA